MTRQPPAPTPQSVTFLTPDDLAPILAKLAEQDTRLAVLEAGAVELEARVADHDTLLQDHEERLVALESIEPVAPPVEPPIEPPVEPVETQEPVPTPNPPPPLPGAGGRLIDPAFGATIIQITDPTNATQYGGVSYSNRGTFNSDNTRLLVNVDNTWVWFPFDPVTLAVGAKGTIPNSGSFMNPMIWDWSGSRPTVFYHVMTGTLTYRQFREYDTATGAVTILRDFRDNIKLPGTVEGAASGMAFTHLAGQPTSPITDLSPHFFVQQSLLFTSGANAGQARVITAYNPATRSLTVAEGFAPPLHGDTFVIEPAGYNNHFEATLDGRWLMTTVVHQSGKGGDLAHILVAYDRQEDALYIGHFSNAQGHGGGVHQIHVTHRAGRPYMWFSVEGGGQSRLLWDVLANTITETALFSHADTGPDGQLVTQVDGGAGIITVDDPTTLTPVYLMPKKQGKTAWNTTYYESWTAQRPDQILRSAFVGDHRVTGWVSDTAPVYRRDNYSDIYASRTLPLTPENDGEVWVNGAVLTYMGTTKTAIVAAGQWAFDPAGSGGKGQVWVRGAADEDLTHSATKTYAFDWRHSMDEIYLASIDGTHRARRICKAYSRVTAPGASQTNAGIYANQSRDGKFAAFTSTWGNRTRRDCFLVVLDRR